MRTWNASRLALTIFIGILCWLIVATICLSIGSTSTHLSFPTAATYSLRRDPILISSLVGAALAAAGVAYQAVLRNPLADPYLLGASSGASLAAYLWQLPAFAAFAHVMGGDSLGQQLLAFIGALASVAVVLGVAGRRGTLEPITLLLVGVIVNAVNGSIFLLVSARHRDLPGTGGPLTFLVGGIQDVTSDKLLIATLLIGAGWIALMYISGALNIAGLGEAEAQALGVRIHHLRWMALLMASLVTAAAVAISGPIGFVGLVCPHVARAMVGGDQRRLLPVATCIGAILLMLADRASRYLASPGLLGTQLQVGILTSFIGGPFFLALLWRRRSLKF